MMLSLGILLLVIAVILITSFRRAPGIGVMVALVIIGFTIWFNGDGLVRLGFFSPPNWASTIVWSIFFGLLIQILSTLVLEPFSDKVTKNTTDHSAFEGLRGSLKSFLLMLVVVWIVAAFVEEIIFRGYMMGTITVLLGDSKSVTAISLIGTSVIFGLTHWYQSKSGALSTGVIGFVLGILFVASGYNLWLPILTHGFIDTFGLFLIYTNLDKALQERVQIFK